MILALRILHFEDLSVGMTETLSKIIASSDVVGFAQLTGDRNPIHLSEHFAAKTQFGKRIAHGLYTASLISAVLGTRLPGPGAVYISQTLNFRAPVRIGDQVDVTATSKGHGYAGVIKRHHFSGFPGSHGTHEYFRHGGSIGNRSYPGRVRKGMRMARQCSAHRFRSIAGK